ncbi:hypothetical protein CBL_07003 [Carabus blaptoides fortunei]
MSLETSEIEKNVKQKLQQINIALNKSVMLLKELNHLTRENGEFNNTMDAVNEQFQILMSIFPRPVDNNISVIQETNNDTSVIIEEEVISDNNV